MRLHRITLAISALLFGVIPVSKGQGPFCGAVGTPGCNAVHYEDSTIIGWATGCTVVRGPVDIINPDGPKVHYGDEEYGIGPASSITTAAVSLGDGGTATLTFDQPIQNNPGPDFAVFENSFNDNFLELAFVEVSSDGEHFVRFPSTSLTPIETQQSGNIDPTMLNNLAGKFRVGYGTPFDLAELSDSAGIDINNITHIRLVDVVGTIDPQYATHDAFGHIVNDPYPTNDTIWGSGGFDLTGVAVLYNPTLSVNNVSSTKLMLYPNPASDRICVILDNQADIEGAIFDINGHLVQTMSLHCGANNIDINALKNGIYVVRVAGIAKKIVKR
ncbi:MAG: T9SS type A sorting domain-containing protein [Bacteroidales bacterium]|nr:T9SS type A sorting domain-containing protein [Bacteroidales bacterium]